MPNLWAQEQEIDQNRPVARLPGMAYGSSWLKSGISFDHYNSLEIHAVKIKLLDSTLFLGIFIAATGCVVEMHPADSSPSPSAMQASAGGTPATAQPVQIVSGPSGISPPVRSAQPTTTTPSSTSTIPATDSASSTTPTSVSAGGTGATLR